MNTDEKITFEKHKFDIDISQTELQKSNGLDASWLTLHISGKDFNIKILNSLRRVMNNNIPNYAFSRDLIDINTNTSVPFDNDQMTHRLAHLPVSGIDPDLYYLSEKYWYKVNYADKHRDIYPDEKKVEIYIDSVNDTDEIINVTTEDMRMCIDDEEIQPYNKKYPMLLIKLRPTEKFKCYMKAVLGIGDRDAIWKGIGNAFYDELENGDFTFTVESISQFSEYDSLMRGCKFLIKKLSMIKNDVLQKSNTDNISNEKIIFFKLDNENHTIGEILNYEFQNHKDFDFSGLIKPDHFINSMIIKIMVAKGIKSPVKGISESIDILINKYSHIGYLLQKLQKKK
jgi:DNA-directed RNA polymerase subunit L